MHCIKTINIEHEYGTTKVLLLSSITFLLVFCFSYVLTSLSFNGWHSDQYLLLFLCGIVLIYPVHKWLHYVSLVEYRKSLSFSFKIQFTFVPVLKMRLRDSVPKRRYIICLLAPFFILNSLFLSGAIFLPLYGHYFCLCLAYHTGMCVLDFLSIKNIWYAPKDAIIEETPRGYEILIP